LDKSFEQKTSDDEVDDAKKHSASSKPTKSKKDLKSEAKSEAGAKSSKQDVPEPFETDHESDIPDKFSITVPRKEFNRICEVSTKQISLKSIGKQQPEMLPVRCIVMHEQEYSNVLKKLFYEKNPYCKLHMGKKTTKDDDEIKKGAAQIRIYSNCTRKGCTAKYKFVCDRLPQEPDNVELMVT
jgi:hypothetical protein